MLLVRYAIVAMLLFAFSLTAVSGQEATIYTDPVDHYQFKLPNAWQAVDTTSPGGQRKLSFVYRGHGDDSELKIRKQLIEKKPLEEFMKEDEANSLRYLPGFLAIKRQESIGGGILSGKMIEFECKRYNKDAKGRIYYLTDEKGNVWRLEFMGRPNFISGLRPDTDQIARSFKPLS